MSWIVAVAVDFVWVVVFATYFLAAREPMAGANVGSTIGAR